MLYINKVGVKDLFTNLNLIVAEFLKILFTIVGDTLVAFFHLCDHIVQ